MDNQVENMAEQDYPLNSFLPQALKALESIQHSLSVLADIQLAAEFHPDHEGRTQIYRQFDEAQKKDSQAADEIQALHLKAKELRNNGDTDAERQTRLPIREAMDHRIETSQVLRKLTETFPAFSRLHQLSTGKEKR
ncbi:hypothetical protein ALO97_01616 [Pseudomonas syringae pv. tagetis]|nr:hypothetical protein ALO97_01616 [Pseudomonas syringae pv. tagetis]